MADLTLNAIPLAVKAFASPVIYELNLEIQNARVASSVTPVDFYIIQDAHAELICSCPKPSVEFLAVEYPSNQISSLEVSAIEILASVASRECEDC
jgi:hypothetical protein